MSNVLLGTCIGDSLGVPFESKPSTYQLLLDWNNISYLGSEHHGLKPGQFSDDGQFSICAAKSLIENNGFNPDDISKRYMELFTSKTIRGYGRTTLAAMNNLIDGKHWSQSGINGSYGNGSAMRAAPFGVYFRNDLNSLINIIKIDSAITHVSEEAEAGAIAIALSAAYAVNNDTYNLLDKIYNYLPDSKIKNSIYSLDSLIDSKFIMAEQALKVIGTKADVRMTVPAVLYCFLKFNNYQEGCEAIIRAGGDTDTGSAILAALYGAKYGMKHFSKYHVDNVEDSENLIILDSQLFNRGNKSFI